MAKTPSPIKSAETKVISKTLSGDQFIVSLQEGQGKVHTIYMTKEESSQIDLGDSVKITLEKVEK
ncbi:MAG: hypothetical protein WC410_00150 [Candidatus Paceibacterota bacterium]|jgi:hypothetical protein